MERIMSMDGSDGYLSDVPTHHSNAPSEVSQDFLASTKVLEKHFRDKYQILRAAYEQRIKQLSEVIQNIYSTVCSDELIKELKNDPSSSMYIPAHLNETIERFLNADREQYIHQLLQKISVVEVDVGQAKRANQSYREEIEKAAKQAAAQQHKYENDLNLLKRNNALLVEENEKLKHFSHLKTQEVSVLEKSFDKNSRELAIIENIGKEEQSIRKELKSSLKELAQNNFALDKENSRLKQELSLNERENEQNRVKIQEMIQQDTLRNKHIEQLMEKFEIILEQENKDSEESLVSVQEKMKNFRNKLMRELKHEKSVNKSFSVEIQNLQHTASEKHHELTALKEQYHQLQHQCKHQENERNNLTLLLDDALKNNTRLHQKNLELETSVKQLLDKIDNCERQHFQEKEMLKDRLILEARKDFLSEQDELEKKALLQRMTQQNQHHQLANDLKNSYFIPNNNNNMDPALAVGDIKDEITLYQIIQRLTKEKKQIMDSQQHEFNSLQQKLSKQHQIEKLQLQKQHDVAINELKNLLQNASNNIEKLRSIIHDHKSTIILQQERNHKLHESITQLNYQLLAVSAAAATATATNDQKAKTKRLIPPTVSKCFRDCSTNTTAAFIPNVDYNNQVLVNTNNVSSGHNKSVDVASDHKILNSQTSTNELRSKNEDDFQKLGNNKSEIETTKELSYSHLESSLSSTQPTIAIDDNSHLQLIESNRALESALEETRLSNQKVLELQQQIVIMQSSLSGLKREIRNLEDEKQNLQEALESANETQILVENELHELKLKSKVIKTVKNDVGTNTETINVETSAIMSSIDRKGRVTDEMQMQVQNYQFTIKTLQEKYETTSFQLEKMKTVLQQMRSVVLQSIYNMKKDQYQLRLVVEQTMLTFEHEKEKTLSNLQLQFKIIFKHYHDKNERKLKDLRIKISNKYSDEYKLLEERYIDQINNLNKAHSSELERVHQELLRRSTNLTIQNDAEYMAGLNNTNQSVLCFDGKPAIAAFESTLNGIIQGLQDQEAVSTIASNKLVSLAKAHTEPSYAANAAARALIGEEIEMLVNKLLLQNTASRQ